MLCADALTKGADLLVTVGAEQSNHARITAAAGARIGLETHLVVGGHGTRKPSGNQLLASLLGQPAVFAPNGAPARRAESALITHTTPSLDLEMK